jgi:hypothetical protein
MFRRTQIDALGSLGDVDEKRARRRLGFRNNGLADPKMARPPIIRKRAVIVKQD